MIGRPVLASQAPLLRTANNMNSTACVYVSGVTFAHYGFRVM